MNRINAAVSLAILLLTSCAARAYPCIDPLGCLEIPFGSPVVIGILYTPMGGSAQQGLDTLAQVEQAIAAKATLLDHDIQLIREATDCTPESAREAALLLAKTPNLVAVVGPSCISDAAITEPILRDAGIPSLPPHNPDATKAVNLLFSALEQTAIRNPGGRLSIPRTAICEALGTIEPDP